MNKVRNISLFFVAVIFLFSSCSGIYNEHQKISNMHWDVQNVLSFKADIPEAKEYKVTIQLRHTSHIQLGNIAVKLSIYPENQADKAEVQNILIPIRDNATGELLGEAMGDLCDTDFVTKFTFKQKGKHTLTLQHVLEEEKAEAIMEVGIKIE
jgi:gliding motility-associated lipoprotein GldH